MPCYTLTVAPGMKHQDSGGAGASPELNSGYGYGCRPGPAGPAFLSEARHSISLAEIAGWERDILFGRALAPSLRCRTPFAFGATGAGLGVRE